MRVQRGWGADMRKFTGIVSFRFQPHRVVILVSKTKNFGFQRRAISRTCALNSLVKRMGGDVLNYEPFLVS